MGKQDLLTHSLSEKGLFFVFLKKKKSFAHQGLKTQWLTQIGVHEKLQLGSYQSQLFLQTLLQWGILDRMGFGLNLYDFQASSGRYMYSLPRYKDFDNVSMYHREIMSVRYIKTSVLVLFNRDTNTAVSCRSERRF